MVIKMQGEKGTDTRRAGTSHVSTTRMVRARTEFVALDNLLVAATKKKKNV